MFYRRKIILALLEAFGGSPGHDSCQNLLFLFCQRRGVNYYDFFPLNNSPYSFLLTQDWSRLQALNYLTNTGLLRLTASHSYLSELKAADRLELQVLRQDVGTLNQEELIQKVRGDFAKSALHNQIICSPHLQNNRELEASDSIKPSLFTIGYEGMSIDAFINTLIYHNIVVLVDVRKNPISMKYGFSKKRLAAYLYQAGLAYVHLPDLGIPSHLRKDLKDVEDYQKLFAYYASTILPEQQQALDALRALLAKEHRIAITCFEADYHLCHRHKIAEYIETNPDFNASIIHLGKDCTDKNYIMYNIHKLENPITADSSSG